MTQTRLPLEGIEVLDLSRALAGPYCSALLADLGATVIKVESAKNGDVARLWPPFEGDHSLYFDSANRNKSSIALDLYSDEGKKVLHRLIARSDVLLENFRPGVMEKMGFAPDNLRREYPELIIGSISGFGNTGPLKNTAGLDQVAQGMSGLMSITGPSPDETYRFGVPIIDMVSGIFSALGIVASLFSRGNGDKDAGYISTSLLESAIALATFQGQKYLSNNDLPRAQGNHHASITPYGVFKTADTPLIIAVANNKQWRDLCDVIGAAELLDDPRFTDGKLRTEHRDILTPLLESFLTKQPASVWLERIRLAGIPVGPIYDYAQVFEDEQVKALKIVREVRRSDGSALPLIRGPLSINGVATDIYKAPPVLGEDSIGVLATAGFDELEIQQLLDSGVIVSAQSNAGN